MVERLALFHAELVHYRRNPVAAEEADEVVVERYVEAAFARVALASGASAQLVVYTARLVALGADYAQAARRYNLVVLLGAYLFIFFEDFGVELRIVGGRLALLRKLVAREELRVSAEDDVRSAARHVRRDCDRAEASCLRDYRGFLVVDLRVQHVVRNLARAQQLADALRMLYRGGADQYRLPLRVVFRNLVGCRGVFFLGRLVDRVGVVLAYHRLVRRDDYDVEAVNLLEFFGLRLRSAGHARELLVHTEVVLERNRRERLVFAAYAHALLRLDRLVQAVGVAASEHQAASELVDYHYLAVLDDVVHVALEQVVRLKRLHNLVRERRVCEVGEEVRQLHDALGLRDARLGQREVALLFVHLEVRALDQLARHGVGDAVGLRVVLRRAGDDERRPRLVYQYRVDLVDDAVVVSALHLLRLLYRHVVTQVVEAELAVRAVGYVAAVGVKTRILGHKGRNDADRQPHAAVDRPHPLRVARGEVVVDRDDVDARPRHRVERDGERRDERFSFARLHLGDVAVVERHASDELLLEVAQAERALRDLADARENLGQYVVEALALFEARAENFSRARELLVRKLLDLRL